MTSRESTFTITDEVAAVTAKSILLKRGARPSYAQRDQQWLPKSQIIECDTDLDEIAIGEEITVEIPRWLAREKGLADE